jgi:hypothetical protein
VNYYHLQRAKRPRMGLREPDGGRYRSPGYRKRVRGNVCAIAGLKGHVCVPTRAAAHLRLGTDGCKDEKPSDWWCYSLCDDYHGGGAHGEQHRIGEKAFQEKYGIDAAAICRATWLDPQNTHRTKYICERAEAGEPNLCPHK